MTYRFSGNCTKCGGATYVPEVWHGVFPPHPECITCHRIVRGEPTMKEVRQEITETKEIIEKMRAKRLELEKRSFSGNQGFIPSGGHLDTLDEIAKSVETKRASEELQKALDEALKEEANLSEKSKVEEFEARMNRLEMMMVSASEQLTRVKEAVNRFSDVLREMNEPKKPSATLSETDLEKL